jgi:transposase
MAGHQLLVGTNRWRLSTVAIEGDGSVALRVVPSAAGAACPVCATPSTRRHSWYRRTALDLPWRGHPVRLRLWARRFFCDAPTCPRKVFAARFAGLLAHYARRTEAVTQRLLAIAQRAGGEAGARLAQATGVPVSPETLRRLLRACAPGEAATPAALGVDEFALRRRQRYGLVLVDRETHRPIDVLPDQEASPLAAWRRRHPGVGAVARDRGPHSREGVTLGAPDAIPVADRFHLLRNVVDALDAVQQQRRRGGSAAYRDAAHSTPLAPPAAPAEAARPPPWATAPAGPAARQPSPRVGPAQGERARALRTAGHSVRSIGRALGLAPKPIRRLLARAEPPQQEYLHHRPVPKPVAPFLPYLQQRWLEGCHNGRQLTRELEARGYRGSGSSVRWLIARWRPPKPPPPARRPRLLRRHGRWLRLRDPAHLKEDERPDLERVLAADPVLAAAHALVQQFRTALHARDLPGCERWLCAAQASGLPPFESLAAGLLGDYDAVRNAFIYPWSTGPVEGAITRVKLLKRQGYGRAKTPLLRARVLGGN